MKLQERLPITGGLFPTGDTGICIYCTEMSWPDE